MPKRIVPLSDVQVKYKKPQSKDIKLFDGDGLYLLVTKSGGKLWHFKYRFDGKEKKLTFGSYPEVSLDDARDKRLKARKLVKDGIDPGVLKHSLKVARFSDVENTFETVALEWHKKFSGAWSISHSETTIGRLKYNVFPEIGARPIKDIKVQEVLAMLNRIESRGALETAHRVRTICGQIFRYAVATCRVDHDITVTLKGALPPYKKGHHAAITDPKRLAPLLLAIDGYHGSHIVKCALKVAPLLFVRPSELRKAEWSEFDFEDMQWNIPSVKMKMGLPHIVPLSKQSIAILKELHPLTGHGKYLFPSARSLARPMSDNAVNAALRRMGFDGDTATFHGFRSTARTILDEVLSIRPDFIEHQLAHTVKDANGRAYNRTSHLGPRRDMMQLWADYLDGLKVIP